MSIKKFLYVFTMGVYLLTACSKNKSNSKEDDLINKLKTEYPDCSCNPFLNKYNWEGKIVYMKGYAGPACDWMPVYYDSDGEKITFDEAGLQEFNKKSTFINKIWLCKESDVEQALIDKVKAGNPNCTCDPYIKQYEWKGRVVYVQAAAGPACNYIPFFYNSSGERFELPGGTTFDEFFAEAKFIKDVWSCKHQ